MVKPLGYYTGYDPQNQSPIALHLLVEKFGDYLQQLGISEKLALLAIISRCLAVNAQFSDKDFIYTLEDAWSETDYDIPPELGGLLESLNELGDGDLLGICQTLIANHNHAEVAA